MPKENKNKRSTGGFTIIELLVCVSIIALISGVAFWNGRGFNDKLTLTSAAEDVSLAIREGQSYGSSVRESASGTGLFNYGYGIDFDKANPTYVIVFVDTNGNKVYDGTGACSGGGDECVEKIPLRNGVVISNACIIDSSGNTTCPAGWTSVQAVFVRPNLDATINAVNGGNNIISGGPWAGGEVILQSRLGATKTVLINSAGQVSVQ